MEKKRDLIKSDWDAYFSQIESFESEKREFEEWAKKIQETSLRLAEEREKVLVEKQ